MNIILNYIARASAGIGTLISGINPLIAILAALSLLIVLSMTQIIVYAIKISKNKKYIKKLDSRLTEELKSNNKTIDHKQTQKQPISSELIQEVVAATLNSNNPGRIDVVKLHQFLKQQATKELTSVEVNEPKGGPLCRSIVLAAYVLFVGSQQKR